MVDYAALIAKHGGTAPEPSAVDYAALIAKHGGTAPEKSLTAERAVPVAMGAAAPTVVGALGGMGAAALGGGAAIPAALGGAALLGGAELVGNLYNVARSATGYKPVKTPFEYIRGALPQEFQPQTPQERMLAAGVEGGLGAATGAGAARSAINAMSTAGRAAPAALNVLAAQPVAQTAAGIAAPVAAEAAQQAGADPYTQFGAAILGGVAAGKSVSTLNKVGRTASATLQNIGLPSTQQLGREADAAFNAVKRSGLEYEPLAVKDFRDRLELQLEADYDPASSPKVMSILNGITKKADAGKTSIKDLHDLRKRIGNELRSGFDPSQRTQRAMGGIMTDALDDFITDPNTTTVFSKAVLDPTQITQTFQDAISKYKMMSQSAEIEQAVSRAAKPKADFGSVIQTQMSRIASSPARLRRFTPEQQQAISSIAAGEFAPGVVSGLSRFAPSLSVPGLLKGGIQGGIGYAGATAGMPLIPAAMGGLAAGGLLARGGRNILANMAMRNLAASTRGGALAAPLAPANFGLPAMAQGVNAMAPQ
jgi:hypothetical protein